jgi:hypothetical protein
MLKLIKQFIKKETRDNAINHVSMTFKSTNQIIEEIHEEFYSEVDKLLKEAKIANSLDTDKQELINKCNRLKALGFTNTKEVKEAEEELSRIQQLKIENSKKDAVVKAINHFSFKYPQYKFITEDSVKKICAKYNLVYAKIDKYIGTVPDKNVKQMEEFKIHSDDVCWEKVVSDFSSTNTTFFGGMRSRLEKERKEMEEKAHQDYLNSLSEKERTQNLMQNLKFHNHYLISSMRNLWTKEKECPLEIAAPLSDFDTKNMELKNFQLTEIHIPDPVVLKPVYFEGVGKCYLIVTAWGLEASDDLVVNQKMN